MRGRARGRVWACACRSGCGSTRAGVGAGVAPNPEALRESALGGPCPLAQNPHVARAKPSLSEAREPHFHSIRSLSGPVPPPWRHAVPPGRGTGDKRTAPRSARGRELGRAALHPRPSPAPLPPPRPPRPSYLLSGGLQGGLRLRGPSLQVQRLPPALLLLLRAPGLQLAHLSALFLVLSLQHVDLRVWGGTDGVAGPSRTPASARMSRGGSFPPGRPPYSGQVQLWATGDADGGSALQDHALGADRLLSEAGTPCGQGAGRAPRWRSLTGTLVRHTSLCLRVLIEKGRG